MSKLFLRVFVLILCFVALSGAAAEPVYTVDFPYLNQLLPEMKAFFYQPDTDICQPVMCNESDSYYLRNNFYGRYDNNGALSIHQSESTDCTSDLTIIYGRNCMNNSLLGSLSQYRDSEYYEAHPCFYLITEEVCWRLDVFAGIRTTMSDNESWRVTGKTAESLYRNDLASVLERSFLSTDESMLPTENDGWVILANDSPKKEGSRYVLYTRKRVVTSDEAPIYADHAEMDSREGLPQKLSAEGIGEWYYYAQNDPIWKSLLFETGNSAKRRPFGDGGCGPTSVAIVIANLVSEEELPKLLDYASYSDGYIMCSCTVNNHWCNDEHPSYQLRTAAQFSRYLPIIIGNFATGNNTWGIKGRLDNGYGTNMQYLDAICEIYGLTKTNVRDLESVVSFLREKRGMVLTCSNGKSPLTATSHFLVLCAADEEYLYILDPLYRESYDMWDVQGLLEILTPGLLRIRITSANECNFAPIALIERAENP